MSWNLDNDRPIYLQLMDRIKCDIISGKYAPGDKLPSVRELAMDASVNPNTMQKALSELERDGLVYARRTTGRFITEDQTLLGEMKRELAKEHVNNFLVAMKSLGFNRKEALALLQEFLKGEEL